MAGYEQRGVTGGITDFLGPNIGALVKAGQDWGEYQRAQASGTGGNATDRRVSQDFYDMAVQPTLDAGMLAFNPMASTLSTGAASAWQYYLSQPSTREDYVSAQAGPRAAY